MQKFKWYALCLLLCLCFTACGSEPADTKAPPDTTAAPHPNSPEAFAAAYAAWEYRDRFNPEQYGLILSGRDVSQHTPRGNPEWDSYYDLSIFSAYTEQDTYTPDTKEIPVYLNCSENKGFYYNHLLRLERWNEEKNAWERLNYAGGSSEIEVVSDIPSTIFTLPPHYRSETEGATYLCGSLSFSNLLYPEWEEWPVGKYRAVAFIGANSAALYAPFEIVEG